MILKIKLVFLLNVAALFLSIQVSAQETDSTNSYLDMSLQELLGLKVSVTKGEQTLRETPSIVSIITATEIKNMGARDLMDVLNMVPGFNFGVDVAGVVGMSTRGNWSHEGKVLLLIDGQEMNELLFANTEFGMHYDVNQIERIEIIRGPGSSLYGGFAELGVINVITKSGENLKGIQASTSYGRLSNTYSRKTASVSVGHSFNKMNYSVSGYLGTGQRSNLDYSDVYGTKIKSKGNTDIHSGMINAGLGLGKFSARVMYDRYSNESPWFYDQVLQKNVTNRFNTLFGELKYDGKIGKKLTILPKINYKGGTSWASNFHVVFPNTPDYQVDYFRIMPSVNLKYAINPIMNIMIGLDSYFDRGNRIKGGSEGPQFYNGSKYLSFHNIGSYFQYSNTNSILPYFIGARYDNHSQYGSAFSPRVGVTKVIDKFHFKILYSRAFRSPVLENLNFNPGLKPEHTGVGEIELGYNIGTKSYLTFNLYDIRINNPIIYYNNSQFPGGNFINYESTGSRGFEVEYRYKTKKGYLVANYSYYTSKGLNKAPVYQVPGHDNVNLGTPGGRFNLYGNIQLTPAFSINPSFSFVGKRHALTSYDFNSNLPVYGSIAPKYYLNIFLQYEPKIFKGLGLSLGVNDLLNQKQIFIQPYNSYSAPMPGVGREFVLRLNYTF